jgi:hypothetical protein
VTKADLAVRLVKAEMLLHRIRGQRVDSAIDPGGADGPLETLYTIERFIDGHFDGTYWGDIRVYPSADEADLLKLCEEAQGTSRSVG